MTDQTHDDSREQAQEPHQDQSGAQPDAPFDPQPDPQPDSRSDEQPGEPGATDRPDSGWSTGDTRVDDAVARLEGLDERDLNEHVEVYDSVHRDLADVLDDAGTPPSSA
ncbi:MAG: hypothetical protein WAK18_10860 [Nocardioidaceae bacterium]